MPLGCKTKLSENCAANYYYFALIYLDVAVFLRAPLKIQSSPKCKAREKFRSAAYVLYVSKKFFP